MTSPFATKQRERKLSVGLKIVWRYKGDKTWGQAYVKESFAKGKVVCLAHNEYASYGNNVAVADIDWHIK